MCAPFNTRSGYGDHARSIFYSIMDRDDLDIKCLDVNFNEKKYNFLLKLFDKAEIIHTNID